METRIERLEAANRRLSAVVGVLSFCIVGFVAMGAQRAPASTRAIRTEQVTLVDAEGNVRGFFGIRSGAPTLTLESKTQHVELRIDPSGVTGFSVLDLPANQDGVLRCLVGVNKDGSAGIGVLDKAGKVEWKAP